jgi:hypothetical protein
MEGAIKAGMEIAGRVDESLADGPRARRASR